jgi:hypothetical protein
MRMRPKRTPPDHLNASGRKPGGSFVEPWRSRLCLALHVLFSHLVTELDTTNSLHLYHIRLYAVLYIHEPSD